RHREDWGLDDPTGKNDNDFIEVIKKIETKIKDLKSTLSNI
ncbi:MAG TPA: low molecular weight phosphatase family protein, partial [Synergistaceae bacterium]|nr:low molecular weight phosphatase family protein [Synergistaceae bacterium]